MQSKEAVASLVDELQAASQYVLALVESKEHPGILYLHLSGLLNRAAIALDSADRNARADS